MKGLQLGLITLAAGFITAGIVPAYAGCGGISAAGGVYRGMIDCQETYCRTISDGDVPAAFDMDLLWDYRCYPKAVETIADWDLPPLAGLETLSLDQQAH